MRTFNGILVSALMVSAVGLAPIASATNCPGPDANGKVCQANPAGCDTETAPPNLTSFRALGACTDDGAVQLTGVFIPWYGVTSNIQCIDANGYIMNQACGVLGAETWTNDCPLPDATTPQNIVAGIWDDLNCAGNAADNIFVDASVAAGLKVRFVDVPLLGDATARLNFNITMYTAGDKADVRIISVVDPGTATLSSTTGTENTTSTAGLVVAPCNTVASATLPAFTCTRFIGFVPPPTLTDVLTALAALETKIDALGAGGGGIQALETKLDAIQLILTPPTAGCTIFNCKSGNSTTFAP